MATKGIKIIIEGWEIDTLKDILKDAKSSPNPTISNCGQRLLVQLEKV